MFEEKFYNPRFTYLEYGIVGKPANAWSDDALQAYVDERSGDETWEIGGNDGPPLAKVTIEP